MMKLRIGPLLLLAFSSGCSDRHGLPWDAYLHNRDAIAARMPILGNFGIHRCQNIEISRGEKIFVTVPLDQCVKMQRQRRMHGIWLDEFEGSRFFEGAEDPADVRRALAGHAWPWGEWLDVPWPIYVSMHKDRPSSRMVLVDFIGRRTVYKGRYGHMGGSQSEVLIDRLISKREIYRSKQNYMEDELPR